MKKQPLLALFVTILSLASCNDGPSWSKEEIAKMEVVLGKGNSLPYYDFKNYTLETNKDGGEFATNLIMINTLLLSQAGSGLVIPDLVSLRVDTNARLGLVDNYFDVCVDKDFQVVADLNYQQLTLDTLGIDINELTGMPYASLLVAGMSFGNTYTATLSKPTNGKAYIIQIIFYEIIIPLELSTIAKGLGTGTESAILNQLLDMKPAVQILAGLFAPDMAF
jgi:hypothetical protein